ncbi:Signal peptide peptidase-like 2B [Hypsibius exemplaris]|uniref:Signal peptide peptidase-like 2B n=1 Tax=Hypsibius exemplaris TaxID=2072580 RepID=A0A1W0X2R6_HYPEX|nr:Signal peptide peptidase-like 2B [Hypsibius exemplaris]
MKIMLVLVSLLLGLLTQVSGDAAILNVSYVRERNQGESSLSPRSYVTFCAAYNPELSKLPAGSAPRTWTRLQVGGPEMDLCYDISEPHVVSGGILAVTRHNCSAFDQAFTAQQAKAAGLIIASYKMFFPGQPNVTVKDPSAFPILILKRADLDVIEELPFSESWMISFYAAEDGYVVDGSGICLIVIAVVVIIIGTHRSGWNRFQLIQAASERAQNAMEPKTEEDDPKQQTGVHFGSWAVVVFALFMTGLLISMYYFYDYLVYVFMGLFVIGAISGCYECFKPILQWTEIGAVRISMGDGHVSRYCGPSLDIRGMVLFIVSCSLAATWVVFRNDPLGWILLDLLGSFLLVSVLIGIQVPNLKACTIFLSLLFIYDVFFVFITPLFTKDGQSVMMTVATGGYDPTRDSGSGLREVIPAAFKVPHIPTGALCEDLFDDISYSLLGFGDVMVPGFLISYLRAFELVTKIRPVYSVPALFAYLMSLVITTVALIFMRTGQPALLYIVPILLATVFVIAWRRRELSSLWRGNLVELYRSHHGCETLPHDKPSCDEDPILQQNLSQQEVLTA